MFLRLIALFLFIGLATFAASWLVAQPGRLYIEWLGWHMEMRSSLAVTIVTFFALSLVFFDRLQRSLRAMPRWLGGHWQQRRDVAGHHALTLGLMAVSAGEPTEARKQAARAHRLLDAPQLTGLLSAQAAHLAGDHEAARRYFTELSKNQDTAFLGQIGLMRLAVDAKDPLAAQEAASKALELKPQSGLAAAQLLKLHADQGHWTEALKVIEIVIRDRNKQIGIVTEMLLRQRTALLYLDGMTKLKKDNDMAGAKRQLEEALQNDPAFLPAVFVLADCYVALDRRRNAIKLLEKSFTLAPHSDIAGMLQKLWGDNDGNTLAKMIRLIPKKSFALKNAAYQIISNIAVSKKLDGEAKRFGDLYDVSEAAFGWQCLDCKSLHEFWHSHCPSCGHFAALKWQQPEKVTPLLRD